LAEYATEPTSDTDRKRRQLVYGEVVLRGLKRLPESSAQSCRVRGHKPRNDMNTRQRRILMVGLVVVAAMCVVPPWEWTLAYENTPLGHGPAGYGLVFSPPASSAAVRTRMFRVDLARLSIQVLACGALCGALMLAAGGRGKDGGA
jgi:hypothetical protein